MHRIPPRIVNRFTADLNKHFQFRGEVMPRRREANAPGESVPDVPESSATSGTDLGVGPSVWSRDVVWNGYRFIVVFSGEPK